MLGFDVLVAHQTYAYKDVALGVPTLMMGEDIAPAQFQYGGAQRKNDLRKVVAEVQGYDDVPV